MYNEIIMQLSKKNKHYRSLNEPLIHRLRELAKLQANREKANGSDKAADYTLLQSQKTMLRSDKIMACGTFIELHLQDNTAKVKSGNFCHDKFCALCSKIKSVKRYSQMLNVLNYLRETGQIYDNEQTRIIGMITLTQRNVTVENLADELDTLQTAIKRLTQSKTWQDSIKGYAKSLEITYNPKEKTYHPHFHFLVVWDKQTYNLSTQTIQQLWKRSLRIGYYPQCDIREAYGQNADLSKIISECLKYNVKAAKESDKPLYSDLTVQEFETFINALKGRRFISYSGVIAEVRNILKYPSEDTDKSTNVQIPTDIQLPKEAHDILLHWSESEQQYKLYPEAP